MAIVTQSTGGLDIEAQNNAVTRWASMVQRRMRSEASILSNGKDGTISRPGRNEKKLSNSIRTQNRKTYGIITGQSFIFERHGVFVHKGVGRGYQMQGGMVIRTAKSQNPVPQREPFEWFNPVMQQSLPELADKLAEINADAVVNATRMLIR
jgi:hypothetical protein